MSQKINAVVFSKDKAAQLKIFIDSVVKNAKDVFDLNVIIEYTDDEYKNAYETIVTDYTYADVNFIYIKESFKDKVLEVMKEKCDYFTFFLDDDIIYREVKLADITNQIESDDDVVCFSLRLGENTTKCYTLGAENVIHDMEDCGNSCMKWDWALHYLDFGYPFSLDGHIFRRKDIYKLVRKSNFVNAEELEMALFDYTETFPRNLMVSYKDSALVNAPAGRVQQSIEDDMEMAYKESEARVRRKLMNAEFMAGNFATLESLDFSNIEGCHQKLDFGKLEIETSAIDKVAIKKFGKRWDETTEDEKLEIDDIFDKFQEIVKQKEEND
jgi:hypothetical protein